MTDRPDGNVGWVLQMTNRNNTQPGISPREQAVRSLSNRHQVFLQHYPRTWNATKPVMASGYTQKSGQRSSAGHTPPEEAGDMVGY